MVKVSDSDQLEPLRTQASPRVVLISKVRTSDSRDRSFVRNP